jgi:hypothetical protein
MSLVRSSSFSGSVALAAAGLLTACLNPTTDGNLSRAGRAVSALRPGCERPPLLLVLDEEALGVGKAPNHFTSAQLNSDVAAPGLRRPLPFFAAANAAEIVLPSGEVGDEGWFALRSARIAWRSAGPDSTDGLRNYVEAGPGLGSADSRGRKESLLDKVPDIAPLRATGLAALVGRSICAVALKNDVRITSYQPLQGSLQGDNLGLLAFQVLSVSPASGHSSSRLPDVKVRVLDARTICEEPLQAFAEAPAPKSYCEPRDIDPPSCAGSETLLNENWDFIDPLKWTTDGEGKAEGGLFFAKDGSNSVVADWVRPCPVPLESASVIRMTNRIQFNLPEENDFAESGALFFVNAGDGSSFDDYLFLNIGYTTSPSKVFVDLFGADGGEPFDRFMESSLAYGPSILFNLDLWIGRNSYRVGLGGEVLDTVELSNPIPSIALFEVGVQQNGGGLRGLLDNTQITKICESDCKPKPRSRPRCEPRTRCQKKGSKTSHAKADHGRCHHSRWKERNGTGDGKRSHKGSLAKASAWSRAVPDPCGRNKLIRVAREKIAGLANPPQGLLILSRMPEVEGCED